MFLKEVGLNINVKGTCIGKMQCVAYIFFLEKYLHYATCVLNQRLHITLKILKKPNPRGKTLSKTF